MFRLAICAITTTIVCADAAWVDAQVPIRPAHEAVASIEALGGRVYRTSDGLVDIVDLKGAMVTDDHLVLLQSLPSVRRLNLDGSRVTDDGLKQLLNLPNLEEVSLRHTPVTPAAAKALKDRHPKIYFVEVDRTGLRFERLALVVIMIPVGLWGAWLIRITRKKRSILPPRLYARGLIWGSLLMVAFVALLTIAIVQTLGFDFHLADLLG
jgi:hypothetical protein